jgi:ribose transport system substrate-binding protein
MESLIRSFQQIDGVIAANDAMAIGALEVLEKRNRKAVVIGINGSKEAVELIKAGKLLASGEFSGFVIGCLGTEIAIQNLRKRRTPKELILKPVVIDTTNYQQYEARIEQRQCPTLADEKLNGG